MAVDSMLLPCGMEATLWEVAPDGRCDALRCSCADDVDTADDAVCPCVGPVPEASVPAEVGTGCATMTEAECGRAFCSCSWTVSDEGGMAEAEEAMMYDAVTSNWFYG